MGKKERERGGECVCVYVCVRESACVLVCACEREGEEYVCVYVCVRESACVRVCVCERERVCACLCV